MNNKPGLDRPRVSRALPHPSWNLDRPILFWPRATPPRASAECAADRHGPEEIWALVDADQLSAAPLPA